MNSNKTSLVLLDQVVGVLEDNEKNETGLIETLKEDYIIRAQTVSYILTSKPQAEYDVEELNKIAELMRIDEIHLFNADGVIYSGSIPKYYGLGFDDGEQIGYFKPMLSDKSLTMCQDVTPNTAEAKSMMYAIVWNDAGDKMIQVGIEPVRLLEELRQNEVSEVIANMPSYDGFNIIVANSETGVICGSTYEGLIDTELSDIGIIETDIESGKILGDVLKIDGSISYYNLKNTGEYIVVAVHSLSESINNFILAMVIEIVYLIIAGAIIFYMVRNVINANAEKEAQMAILVSMSDIYNSMHLINLENNTLTEYSARDEVSEVVNNSCGADEAMHNFTELTINEEYYKEALEFTDVHTLAERMRNKKIISKEFLSQSIGWYRASFITINTNEEGCPTKVIYVTQNIDKEKKKEEELILKSNVDELTGLYNRRAFVEDMTEYDGSVTDGDFVFVSFDVNGLKRVNDTMGHAAGDELLKGAAHCISECFAPYGKVYRMGGDEYAAMIFADEVKLEEIKRNFEAVTANWSGNLVKSLSISSGYAARRDVDISSAHDMANIADKLMYEEKARHYGRR
jgi:diguanylate cyclase (GGDEF)-like protein